MAKRWKQEDDEREIEIPPFDKETFVKEEIRKLRIYSIYSGLGLIAGLISGLAHFTNPLIGLGVGITILTLLLLSSKEEALLNLPVSSDREIIGGALLYIFGWIGMWTLFINPPFGP